MTHKKHNETDFNNLVSLDWGITSYKKTVDYYKSSNVKTKQP